MRCSALNTTLERLCYCCPPHIFKSPSLGQCITRHKTVTPLMMYNRFIIDLKKVGQSCPQRVYFGPTTLQQQKWAFPWGDTPTFHPQLEILRGPRRMSNFLRKSHSIEAMSAYVQKVGQSYPAWWCSIIIVYFLYSAYSLRKKISSRINILRCSKWYSNYLSPMLCVK